MLGATGCARQDQQHVLRLANGRSDYSVLNPYMGASLEAFDLEQLTMAELVRSSNDSDDCKPELLTELPSVRNGQIRRDLRRITLHLRPNLRWSDGAPLTAKDVVFTKQEVTAQGGAVFSADWRRVSAIRATDDRTVVVDFKAPTANVVSGFLCTGDMRWILPEHLLTGVPLAKAPYNSAPIGAGPFRYAKVSPDSEIDLEPNPFYFGGRPKLKRISVRSVPDANTELVEMQTGELDMLANLSADSEPAARRLQNVRVLNLSNYGMLRILFNVTAPVVRDEALRRALRIGLNRREIVRAVFHGDGATFESPFIPEDSMQVGVPYAEFNPQEARRQLDAIGWHLGPDGVRSKDGRRLAIDLIAPIADIGIDKTIELIRVDWSRIGVELSVHRLPHGALEGPAGRMTQGRFDAAIIVHGTASASIEQQWTCANAAPRGFNEGRFCDSRVDQIISKLEYIDDAGERRRLLDRFQRIIAESAASINILQVPNIFVIGPRVHNLHDNDWSMFDRFEQVDVY